MLVRYTNVIGVDIVETNPMFDISNMTTRIAATFVVDVVSAYYSNSHFDGET